MINRYIFFTFLFSFLNSLGQEIILEINDALESKNYQLYETIPIVNKKANKLSLLMLTSKNVKGFLINEKNEVISNLSLKDNIRKYSIVLGHSYNSQEDYRIIIANRKNNKFGIITFSYTSQTTQLKEFEFNSPKERFIQTVQNDDKFYLLSFLDETSTLNIYSFDDNGNYEVIPISLENENLLNIKNEPTPISAFFFNANFPKIDYNNPTSIEVSSEVSKLYIGNGQITFSFDNNKKFTQIVSIDLNSYTYRIKKYLQPLEEIEKYKDKKTNSFLGKEYIYLFASDKDHFEFRIEDLATSKIVKSFKVDSDDVIQFKNTPLIQKGGNLKYYRELEGTNKFLRKINTDKIGVSVFYQNENYIITLGGTQLINNSSPMMIPTGIGVASISTPTGVIYHNPFFTAYNSYSTSKAIYFQSYFDNNLRHIEGEIPDNAFERIKEFEDNENKIYTDGKTIFKHKNYFLRGAYSSFKKSYILRKFEK